MGDQRFKVVWLVLNGLSRRRSVSIQKMEKKSYFPVKQLIFGLLATTLLFAYYFYLFVIPQTPARSVRPSTSLAGDFPLWSWIVSLPLPIPDDPKSIAILLILTTLIAFAVYGLAIYLSRKLQPNRSALALVLFPACVYLILSTLALPNLNTDIFNYMLRGRLSTVYHKNPYIAAADDIPFDPVYPYASHAYTEDAEWWKLPLWTSIEIGLAKLTGDNVAVNILVYRAAFMLVNFSNLVLIAIILRRIFPGSLLTGLVVYAWNPIIVILGQSKGDTFIVLFLLLTILFMVLERRTLAIFPLTLSVLIKLTTLPLAAAYLLTYLKRRKWKDYFIIGILFALTAGIFYIGFGLGENLPAQLLSIIGMSGASVPDFFRSFLRVIFVGGTIAIGLTRSGEQKQMIWGWLLLTLYFSLFLVSHEKAWYLIPLIALAALIPDWRAISMTGVISFTGYLIYAWNTGFSTEFPAPIFISFPRYIIYLTLPLVVLIVIGAVLLRKKLKQDVIRLVGVTPKPLSHEEP